MLHFACDYQEGCHPRILEKMIQTNLQSTAGYGHDPFTKSAAKKIREACGLSSDIPVEFCVGGTQANLTVIASILRPYESVIAVKGGHISIHEAGAIEATGHKVDILPAHEGKMVATDLARFLDIWQRDPTREHLVKPALVYISQSTEVGTVYTLAELEALYDVTRRFRIPLFIDGARLGYAAASVGADFTLQDIARLCDVFYIGGTKVGALFGEAVVFPNAPLGENYFTLRKQRGAVLAKGRLLGIQFDVLFTDNLYLEISRHAIAMAMKIRDGLKTKGYVFLADSPSNQQFVILENAKMNELAKSVVFSPWEIVDDTHTAVRFCTSWATTPEAVDELLKLL